LLIEQNMKLAEAVAGEIAIMVKGCPPRNSVAKRMRALHEFAALASSIIKQFE
jgi:hypothetical protein